MSSLNALQTEQVKTKVLYSEVDIPFNGYLDALNRTTKLVKSILSGGLQSYETQEGTQFSEEYVKNLEQNASLKYLELQTSIDVKKSAQENWEQSNNDTIATMENAVPEMTDRLTDANLRLEERIERVRVLYDSVKRVNTETENLLEGNTSLTTIRSEWVKELGGPLTDKLIKQGYMRKADGGDGEERYRVYDNFTKGPKELRHINQSIKADISRLTEELSVYKSRWLEDANVFSRITSALREELVKRNMNVDVDMDERDEEEEEDEEEEREEHDVEEEDIDEEEEEEERDEYDDEGQEIHAVEEEVDNGAVHEEETKNHEQEDIDEPMIDETEVEPNEAAETTNSDRNTPEPQSPSKSTDK